MRKLWIFLTFTLAAGLAIAFFLFSTPCRTHTLSVNKQTISMFESSLEALSAMDNLSVLKNENQLTLSCKGGFPTHNIQLYVRLACEKDGVLYSSPNATIYNFSSFKNEASFLLRDILGLDDSLSYTLIQYELIYYDNAKAPTFQYAFSRLPQKSHGDGFHEPF